MSLSDHIKPAPNECPDGICDRLRSAERDVQTLKTERDAAMRLREALRRIVWAENRGPDRAAESAYMVRVAQEALNVAK
jgi:hypothetical protein